ncbi:MAG: magnesium chelatase subunit H [Rhodospirillaceae bacterium]|nr:magnesium chelatase subunit H [Rhodospirillaceae bacterium]
MVTLDNHLAHAVGKARDELRRDVPELDFNVHAAADWDNDPAALDRCKADIATGDIIIGTMLFLDDHLRAIVPALEARREDCDAMVMAMSAGEAIRLTKVGAFRMDAPQTGPLALLKKLRGKKDSSSSGEGQMKMLRRLPKILRFIPGKAQDVRAYFLTLQYWLSGAEANMVNMVRFLVDRYAAGPRTALRGALKPAPPVEFPDVGVYHPRMKGRIADRLEALPAPKEAKGTVGVLVLRSYLLSGDTAHYDGVITALEAQGLRVIPAFASGLDARETIKRFFMKNDAPIVDAVVSLTGFSLVGGPAYNDSHAAADWLAKLDVPCLAAQPIEFQTLERWAESNVGLTPVESTIMVAIPEIDGSISPMVFAGRSDGAGVACKGCERACVFPAHGGAPLMQACGERVDTLAARTAKLVALRKAERANRMVAVVLFNFPPNAGAAGTAAYLSVFASLHNTLKGMKAEGYTVDVPDTVEALRARILTGNAAAFGTDANVLARIGVDDHVRRERHLAAIEGQWGAAPGRQLTDSRHIFVLGEKFGNVLVGLQPGLGYEGDPMRLLFEKGFAPTPAFSAFSRYLREDFGAHAVLHFGMHGALEFMPGKHVGLSAGCWPERLIGDLPNFYLYAGNNPSEGALAKRRGGATLISYMTPPVSQAGLYKGLADLKASVERWRTAAPDDEINRTDLGALIRDQAAALDLPVNTGLWQADADAAVGALARTLYEVEQTLIPEGLHVIGEPMSEAARIELLMAMAEVRGPQRPERAAVAALVAGEAAEAAAARSGLPQTEATLLMFRDLAHAARHLARDEELDAILRALDGRFIRPAPGGDVLRNPDVLPTGRNMHGFDPFRIPSAFAVQDGARQAQRLIDRHVAESGHAPETIAMVLWGTDNLKSEGGPIGQALYLMGARPRFDSFGRLCGASLIPLAELGRPRIDVVITLSGIFRDLLPLQIKMLAEAALLAATADEPSEMNFVRKHTLAHQIVLGCDVETAALRIFSNADGAYGANVNQMIDAGCWSDGDELADAFQSRKCFAYGRNGKPARQPELLGNVLRTIELAYQNLDSLELGVTAIDHYVDTLGGISRAARKAQGHAVPVYVGDQTQGEGKVRTLGEQVAHETRTRTLNPRWYEGMLKHGYEGVRQIEAQVTTTMGWSATTGEVAPWVYQKITETFVLDPAMRDRMAKLNPKASSRLANRLIEAHERKFWTPDDATLKALREAGDELEDRLEGVVMAAE